MTDPSPPPQQEEQQQQDRTSSVKKLGGLGDASSYNDEASMSSEGEGTSAMANAKMNADAIQIASKETRALYISRIVVALVLLGAAAGVGALSYILSSNKEQESFEYHFSEMADELFAASDAVLSTASGAFVTMSTTMTSFSKSQGTEWPFYTHPDFEPFGYNYLETTGADLVSWSPVVDSDAERMLWSGYSIENEAWIEEGLQWRHDNLDAPMPEPPYNVDPAYIYKVDGQVKVPETGNGPFAPVWQMSGAPSDPSVVNFNLLSDGDVYSAFQGVTSTKSQVLSDFVVASDFYGAGAASKETPGAPQSLLLTPLFNDFSSDSSTSSSPEMVGAVVAVLSWNLFVQDVLPEGTGTVYAVIGSSCGDSEYTLEIDGPDVTYAGPGHLSDPAYSSMEQVYEIGSGTDETFGVVCSYYMKVYPSEELANSYSTNFPKSWTIFVAGIFVFFALAFLAYDLFWQQRQNLVLEDAKRTNAIVSSLFPAEIRDRLFGKEKKGGNVDYQSHLPENSKFRLKNYLAEEDGSGGEAEGDAEGGPTDEAIAKANAEADVYDTKPIADLFPNTTVLFADIAGFTAWSSVREPSQVFTLLETVYRAFDTIAKRRRVFKVETVGDCYVAVTGLPEPRKDHAVVMAKFAKDCLDKFNELAKKLEVVLGPDTGDLAMRAGLHSGPVTAGVLRGDKSRFQLFGDTVNTAARIESTGMRNRVHVSSDTADLLKEAGKEMWLRKRNEAVTSKGKGALQTWWLVNPNEKFEDEEKQTTDDDRVTVLGQKMKNLSTEDLFESLPPKTQRLVGWNVEILKKILQQIIARRHAMSDRKNYDGVLTKKETEMRKRTFCLDEVLEVIPLPKYNARAHRNKENPNKIEIPPKIMEQLKRYVAAVAAMHRENPFHNFEHASHVTMSVSKLLSRIVAPDEFMNQDNTTTDVASSLHDHTYGITSDPLTQFAVVLSALIHDTDHLGVSNFQLIKEDHKLAKFFKSKSIAEQNSIVVAWDKLMTPQFLELRRTIYGDPSELDRFRQIVVNNVLATDIFDKELSAVRKNRWEKAFAKVQNQADIDNQMINRKATIVMEHLIQASDVAHTMQHWHIYRKWNERLFQEMTAAYQAGRMEKNPADGWYKGELGFFDNYIIPLAKKLKECGVFGVSSDEYLNYALENRREWASKGEEVLKLYIEKHQVKPEEEESKTEDAPPKGKPAGNTSSADGGATVTTETSDSTDSKESNK